MMTTGKRSDRKGSFWGCCLILSLQHGVTLTELCCYLLF
nr:uncharacterized protein CTRU02_00034 [Colletotrichum truncatum]KAF6801285.1 hypothetical protein CTRU02_00034 [Colletotrichum truncatum]